MVFKSQLLVKINYNFYVSLYNKQLLRCALVSCPKLLALKARTATPSIQIFSMENHISNFYFLYLILKKEKKAC